AAAPSLLGPGCRPAAPRPSAASTAVHAPPAARAAPAVRAPPSVRAPPAVHAALVARPGAPACPGPPADSRGSTTGRPARADSPAAAPTTRAAHAGDHRRRAADTDHVVRVRRLHRAVHQRGRARRAGPAGAGTGRGLALRPARPARLPVLRAAR